MCESTQLVVENKTRNSRNTARNQITKMSTGHAAMLVVLGTSNADTPFIALDKNKYIAV